MWAVLCTLNARDVNVNTFCFSSDWSTCQLSPNAVCGSGIKTRLLDCVRSDGKSVDMKFCEEVRPAEIPQVSLFLLSLLFPGHFSFYFLFDTLIFLNDFVTSLITIHYRTLPVLLGPQQHEIFRSIPKQRLLSLLRAECFIHS